MRHRVRLFARAKDLAGVDEVSVELPEGATVADLRGQLAGRFPVLAGLLERSALAVNDEFAEDARTLPSGCEIALLPPVSGGLFVAKESPPNPSFDRPDGALSPGVSA
jgi:molybdopterin converting factor subunit 1